MSRKEKALERLLQAPRDYSWRELESILNHFGFVPLDGKGSRVKFVESAGSRRIINLHKPHPGNIIKQCYVKDVVNRLKEWGYINE